jgi:hypothetical protein
MISSSNISNPNLVSQIASLTHLNDDQLKNYISDKSNPLSPFALATLQSKTIARKKFGTPEAPKQTVADKVEAEADAPLPSQQGLAGLQPQGAPMAPPPPQVASLPQAPQGMAGGGMVAFDEGGVASLPLRDDMYNEDSFAHGGIVGYASKGSVEAEEEAKADRRALIRGTSALGDLIQLPAAGLMNLGSLGLENVVNIGNRLVNAVTGEPVLPTDYEGPRFSNTPFTDKFLGDDGRSGPSPTGSVANASAQTGNIPNTNYAARQKEYFKNYKGSYASPDAAVDTPKADPAKSVNPMKEPLAAQANSASPYTVEEYTPEGIKSPSAFDRTKYNEERRQALIDAGVDPKFYEKQVAKNEKERAALKGEKTDAGWSAALRAGLGMMGGKSQNPWANIAEGATAGLTQYGTDIKDIKSEEKALRAADDKLAEAQYLQGRGDAEGAMKAMKEREALIASVDAMNVQARNVSKTAYIGDKNKMRSDVFKNEQENARLAIQQAGETERSRNQIAATERATKATQDLNLSFKQQESYNKAIDNTNAALTLQYGAGFGGTMPPEEYSKIYFTELKKQQAQLGLKPLVPNASISGMPEGAIFKGSRPVK